MPVMDRNVTLGDGGGGDDLPRTLRREREAQQRAQQHQQHYASAPHQAAHQAALHAAEWSPDDSTPAVVTAFKVPFLRLMMFYLKSVLAGIPALILLVAILWGIGHLLETFFPWLVLVKIQVYVPPH